LGGGRNCYSDGRAIGEQLGARDPVQSKILDKKKFGILFLFCSGLGSFSKELETTDSMSSSPSPVGGDDILPKPSSGYLLS
jgi:hypothetical protein